MLCVCYRYGDQLRKRFKTVELIVKEAPSTPPLAPFAANALVGVRVELAEVERQRKVKLLLKGRIEQPKVSDNTNR